MIGPERGVETFLDLNDDILLMICRLADRYDHQCRTKREARPSHHPRSMLVSLCSVCRQLRDVGTPILHSKAAILNTKRDSAGRPCPVNIAQILRSIEETAHFRNYCKSLRVDINCEQSSNLSDTLAGTVSRLPKLRQLELSVSVPMREHIHGAFGYGNISLVRIEKLSVNTEFARNMVIHDALQTLQVLDHSPNSLKTANAIQTLLRRPFGNIRTLNVQAWWSPELVNQLLASLPQLTTLGTVSQYPVMTLLPLMSGFSTLKMLATAGLHDLRTRYDPPDCGNAYFGPEGKELERRLAKVKAEVLQELSKQAFQSCRKLETLWVRGDGKVVCERVDGEAAQNIRWVDVAMPDLFD